MIDSGAWALELPAELGGQVTPPSVQWAVNELNMGANPAVFLYAAGPKFAYVIWANGTERDKRIAQIMIERQWGATMVLTEPDAGSDVGAGRTRAVPQPDGSLAHRGRQAVHHRRRARPDREHRPSRAGSTRRGRARHQGALAVRRAQVPLRSRDRGADRRAQRRVRHARWRRRWASRRPPPASSTFGDQAVPAVGWLLGEVHNGIAQMFQVIEHARMLVGTKAIATLVHRLPQRAGVRQGAGPGP